MAKGKSVVALEGPGPVMAEAPSVEIGGKVYKVRRLSVKDVFTLGRVLAAAVGGLGARITDIAEDLSTEDVLALLVAGLPYAEQAATELLGGLIGVTGEEFMAMPPEALPKIAGSLVETEDLAAFLESCRGLIQSPGMKDFLNRLSTQSNPDTGGQTK